MYLTLSAVFLLLMGACCIFFKRKKTFISAPLIRLQSWVIVCTILYNLSILRTDIHVAYFLNSLYYSSIHVLVVLMLDFTLTLAELKSSDTDLKLMHIFKRVWLVFLTADITSLLLNTIFRHSFRLAPLFVNHDEFLCWTPTFYQPFNVHLTLCYVLTVLIFFILIRKIFQTNKFYRGKYISILTFFVTAIAINFLFVVAKTRLDFSVLLYSCFSVIATYFTIFSTPKKVQNAMLRQVSENLNIGIFCFNHERHCIFSNKLATRFFPSKLMAEEELKALLLFRKSEVERQIQVQKNDGEHTLIENFCYLKDSQERVFGYLLKFTDITDDLKTEKEDTFRSTHDALTGLLNREAFYSLADQTLKNDTKSKWCLLCTNIKNFKLINDLFGSLFGDNLLKHFARTIIQTAGPDSLTGRIGSDRFAILLKKENFDEKSYLKKLEELQTFTQEVNYKLLVFTGVYEIPNPYESITSIYDKALLASQTLNENYSTTIAYYGEELLSMLDRKKKILEQFKASLESGQFKLYLQPQVSCRTEEVTGAEALVRWDNTEKGILNPSQFISVLENSGNIYLLDRYIWTKACETLQKWQKQGIDLYIAVNVSAKDFYYLDLYHEFSSLVRKYDIPPEKLKIEITETVFMHDLHAHRSVLKKLQDYGFKIEMDDFGSGYSSLYVLKNLDVDVLKIDMAFLGKTEHKDRSKKILRSIIKMAKQMGVKIVVEGIEDNTQVSFFRELECDIFQGFLYSKPVTLKEFEKRFIHRTDGGAE